MKKDVHNCIHLRNFWHTHTKIGEYTVRCLHYSQALNYKLVQDKITILGLYNLISLYSGGILPIFNALFYMDTL